MSLHVRGRKYFLSEPGCKNVRTAHIAATQLAYLCTRRSAVANCILRALFRRRIVVDLVLMKMFLGRTIVIDCFACWWPANREERHPGRKFDKISILYIFLCAYPVAKCMLGFRARIHGPLHSRTLRTRKELKIVSLAVRNSTRLACKVSKCHAKRIASVKRVQQLQYSTIVLAAAHTELASSGSFLYSSRIKARPCIQYSRVCVCELVADNKRKKLDERAQDIRCVIGAISSSNSGNCYIIYVVGCMCAVLVWRAGSNSIAASPGQAYIVTMIRSCAAVVVAPQRARKVLRARPRARHRLRVCLRYSSVTKAIRPSDNLSVICDEGTKREASEISRARKPDKMARGNRCHDKNLDVRLKENTCSPASHETPKFWSRRSGISAEAKKIERLARVKGFA
ncbi:unnamed protein product, partial [Trichogramma brassicae]